MRENAKGEKEFSMAGGQVRKADCGGCWLRRGMVVAVIGPEAHFRDGETEKKVKEKEQCCCQRILRGVRSGEQCVRLGGMQV